MPSPVPLSDLRTRTRELANMEVAAGTSFVPDSELDRRLNQALRGLYDKLVEAHGQGYYEITSPITTIPGVSQYGLPADFYKLSVAVLDDGSNFVPVSPFMPQQRWALQQLGVSNNNSMYLTKYRLQPLRIELLPAPGAAYTLTLHYIPAMTDLVAPGDTFDGVNGWEEWACLTAAIGMLNTEESDPAPLMAERARIDARIQGLVGNRDAGDPDVIQDTRRDWADEYWFWSRTDWMM